MYYIVNFNNMQAVITNPTIAAKVIQGENEAKEKIAAAIAQLEKERGESYPQ